MNNTNRQWHLIERPQGNVQEKHFKYTESPIPQPEQGQVLVRLEWFSFDPAQRTWVEPIPTYLPPVEVGGPMRAIAAGTVISSKNAEFKEGDRVQGMFEWSDYIVADPKQLNAPRTINPDLDYQTALHVLGGTGMTAWAGMRCVADVQAGDTVLVSAAAGATGSVAAQLARAWGARVVGIAGGSQKCEKLLKDYHLDAAVDYKDRENFSKALKAAMPDGLDVYFDNVGGAILDTAFKHANNKARFAMCGQIAHYQSPQPPMRYFTQIILKSLNLKGFLVFDYLQEIAQTGMAELASLHKAGKITVDYDIKEGFQNIPKTLLRLFDGSNQGKQLLKNDIAT